MKPQTPTERRADRARWTAERNSIGRAAKDLQLALSRANRRPLAVVAVKAHPADKIDGTCPACGASDKRLSRRDHPVLWDVEVRENSRESAAPVVLWTPDRFREACELAAGGLAPVLARREVGARAAVVAAPREPVPDAARAWLDEFRRTGCLPPPLPREAA